MEPSRPFTPKRRRASAGAQTSSIFFAIGSLGLGIYSFLPWMFRCDEGCTGEASPYYGYALAAGLVVACAGAWTTWAIFKRHNTAAISGLVIWTLAGLSLGGSVSRLSNDSAHELMMWLALIGLIGTVGVTISMRSRPMVETSHPSAPPETD